MQSQATTVDAYIEEAPAGRQPALRRLRALCLAALSGYEEVMQYGMPCYRRDAVVEVAFASQKRYLALYIAKQSVLDAHRGALAGISLGKGCIRYTKLEKIDFDIVRCMLEETATSNGPVC